MQQPTHCLLSCRPAALPCPAAQRCTFSQAWVWMKPGTMAFTLTPWAASRSAWNRTCRHGGGGRA